LAQHNKTKAKLIQLTDPKNLTEIEKEKSNDLENTEIKILHTINNIKTQ